MICIAAKRFALALTVLASIAPCPLFAQASSNVTVLVKGLNGPRGLKFGPDGALYVAEAGTAGTQSTAGQCTQVIAPVGPYKGGPTARISRVDMKGNRTTVASGFPSAENGLKSFLGVADVAFLNGNMYALVAGGGCSHGNAKAPAQIAFVNPKTGAWSLVANLSMFFHSFPVAYPNADDFEPDGTAYSMIVANNKLYLVEPNHGEVLSWEPRGVLRREIDMSAWQGHIVPTSIAERNGFFYVGNLGLFPITPFASKILTLSYSVCFHGNAPGLDLDYNTPTKLKLVSSKAGFTTVVGTEFGPDGLLYILQLSPKAAATPTPGVGSVVRINRLGQTETVASGLTVPTGMTFGPDGNLYVSNFGAAPPGAGQIVRITVR